MGNTASATSILANDLINNHVSETITDYKKFDSISKDNLISYLKNLNPKKLSIDNTFTEKMKSLELYNSTIIPMNIELYHHMKNVCEEYIPPINKSFKKYVKPEFTKESLKTSVDNSSNFINFDYKTIEHLYEPSPIGYVFNDIDITENEFNNSFSDPTDKKDIMGISKRMIANLPTYHKTRLINAFNDMYNTGENICNTSFGSASFAYKDSKKGSKDSIDSYRKIIAIPNIMSHIHRILSLRLYNHLEKNMILDQDIQKGSVPGQKCPLLQQIIKVKSVINNCKTTNNKKAAVLFLDISDAFGSINRESLFYILRKYSVGEKFINYIDNYYKNFSYFVKNKDLDIENIKWKDGLVQGCPLSPILFITVINFVLTYLNNKYKNSLGFSFPNNVNMLFSAYIDDICIVVNDKDKLAIIYNELIAIFKNIGLNINSRKSGVMLVGYTPEEISSFKLDNVPLVTKYTYLGANISSVNNNFAINDFNKELYGRLRFVDNRAVSDSDKCAKLHKFIIPWVTRQMANMFDISTFDKNNILNIVLSFQKKWNDETHIDIFPDIKGLIEVCSDAILTNFTIEELVTSVNTAEFSNYTSKKYSYTYEDIENDNNIDTNLA